MQEVSTNRKFNFDYRSNEIVEAQMQYDYDWTGLVVSLVNKVGKIGMRSLRVEIPYSNGSYGKPKVILVDTLASGSSPYGNIASISYTRSSGGGMVSVNPASFNGELNFTPQANEEITVQVTFASSPNVISEQLVFTAAGYAY